MISNYGESGTTYIDIQLLTSQYDCKSFISVCGYRDSTSLSAPVPYGLCWSSRTRIPAIPTGLASTMILVSLYGEKYDIAATGENAALALLSASVCGCSHFEVASLRVSLRRGSVMVA